MLKYRKIFIYLMIMLQLPIFYGCSKKPVTPKQPLKLKIYFASTYEPSKINDSFIKQYFTDIGLPGNDIEIYRSIFVFAKPNEMNIYNEEFSGYTTHILGNSGLGNNHIRVSEVLIDQDYGDLDDEKTQKIYAYAFVHEIGHCFIDHWLGLNEHTDGTVMEPLTQNLFEALKRCEIPHFDTHQINHIKKVLHNPPN